jgi:hypothetical protein
LWLSHVRLAQQRFDSNSLGLGQQTIRVPLGLFGDWLFAPNRAVRPTRRAECPQERAPPDLRQRRISPGQTKMADLDMVKTPDDKR